MASTLYPVGGSFFIGSAEDYSMKMKGVGEMPGMIQVYTGNGKGKTTAAIGLAIRALGAGQRVFLGQFVKGMPYSELQSLGLHQGITIRQYGRDCFIHREPTREDIELAQNGLKEADLIMKSGEYELVILDEASIAIYYHLFTVHELLQSIQERNQEVEVVITGRMAPPELLEKADLVTHMEEVKHYYQQGVLARVGIEK